MEAWYMDDSAEDQRLEHRLSPNQPATLEVLEKLGVFCSTLDADNYETDPKLKAIRAERGYDYDDICEISRDKFPNYDAKIKTFYEEHIHEDEEIRYILAGSGYFDVRDENDRWIRIKVSKGDMLVLPEGIYHRFTLDINNYIKAMRLFKGVPIWTPYNRPEADEHPSRAKYSQLIGSQAA